MREMAYHVSVHVQALNADVLLQSRDRVESAQQHPHTQASSWTWYGRSTDGVRQLWSISDLMEG